MAGPQAVSHSTGRHHLHSKCLSWPEGPVFRQKHQVPYTALHCKSLSFLARTHQPAVHVLGGEGGGRGGGGILLCNTSCSPPPCVPLPNNWIAREQCRSQQDLLSKLGLIRMEHSEVSQWLQFSQSTSVSNQSAWSQGAPGSAHNPERVAGIHGKGCVPAHPTMCHPCPERMALPCCQAEAQVRLLS